jgi:RNA recognition motif-containing protein
LIRWFCRPVAVTDFEIVPAVRLLPAEPEKAGNMEVQVYVRNLAKSTTQEELQVLFTKAGTVTAVSMIKDRKSGASKGFALITMSSQNEADKAVSMFNSYSFDDRELRVDLVKPREQRGFGTLN